jgi:DNA-binding transcriptional LysR family regulator
MAELSEGEFGHVRVGSIEPTASLRLPEVLARYCGERPRVRLSVEVTGTETVAAKVAAGELDVGVCSPPRAHGEDLLFEPLFVEGMALLVPEGHPLAEVEAVEADDLAGHRLMLSGRSCAYRGEVERVLAGLGANAPVGVEIGSIEIGSMAALKEAARRGLGVAVLPEAAISPPPTGTKIRGIRGVDLGLTVGILLPRDGVAPSRALEAFVLSVREALAQPVEQRST